MPIKNFVGGDPNDVAAAELNRYLIQSSHVIKTSNESVTSSTTVQNDDQLFLQVEANTNYWFMGLFIYTGDAAGDFQVKFSSPSGSTLKWLSDALGAGATTTSDIVSRTMQGTSSGPAFGCITGSDAIGIPKGLLQVGSSGGTFRLTWAQSVSSGTATTLKTGSMLMIRRLVD